MKEEESFCDLLDRYLELRDEVKQIYESENRLFSSYKDERENLKEARIALDEEFNKFKLLNGKI